ncbi:hypothetical protein TNCV_2587481 [Trichonephila clavipes]|nr:hypothetical protein TNCV_2587481 [Trichonephila clavipes]
MTVLRAREEFSNERQAVPEFAGLLPLLQKLGMKLCSEMKGYFWYPDKTRIVDSTRHSKPDKKLSRKK